MVVDDGTVTVTTPPFRVVSRVGVADAAIMFAIDEAFSLVAEVKIDELPALVFSSCTDPRFPATAEDVAVSRDSVGKVEAFGDGEVETAWLGTATVADFSIVK